MASHLTYFLLWRRCPYVQRFPAWWNICSLKCLRGKFLNLSAILKYIGSSLWSFVCTANNAGFLVQLRALAPVIHSKWKSHETWNLNFVWSRKTNGILDHLEIFEYKSQTIIILTHGLTHGTHGNVMEFCTQVSICTLCCNNHFHQWETLKFID